MDRINKIFKRFPFIAQYDTMDCGPACLCMVSKYYGKTFSLQYIRSKCFLTREGVSLLGMSEGAKALGFDLISFKGTISDLRTEKKYPCILFWKQSHFVVLYSVKKIFGKYKYFISDPAKGKISLTEDEFKQCWLCDEEKGVVSFIEPTQSFYTTEIPQEAKKTSILSFLYNYVKPFRQYFFSLFLTLIIGGILAIGLPFLTQILIDKGINNNSVSIVISVLISQIIIYVGTIIMEIVRNWLVIYIGARVNINIISDYLKRIIKLPMSFFDTKFINDFYQRISDHSRIEKFLTSQALVTMLSLLMLIVYLIVLYNYSLIILTIYLCFTIVSIFWAQFFMEKRGRLDYFRFKYNAINQDTINEMFQGIQEIKLNNYEDFQINKWKRFQQQTFNNNQALLKNEQFQMIGFGFITQIKTTCISFVAALLVIEQNLTLGEMMAISFIIGQLDSPITQLVDFLKSLQDAILSLRRLLEVQSFQQETKNKPLPLYVDKGIVLNKVSFSYEGPLSPLVLKDINLTIPAKKITAFVGKSGCGKTTLLKLLLKLYNPTDGDIYIGENKLSEISFDNWKNYCSTVMQESFIFSDTIARNVALGDEEIDQYRLKAALLLSNAKEFVDELPLKEGTIIGMKGNGLSVGQKQRLLLARAIYSKRPYVFLDEATSALDAVNEREIYDNLNRLFINKTVIVIAHRLSTIKNADQIVVIDNGNIAECGDHNTLMARKGIYYTLIKNQLMDNEKK